MLQPKSKQGYKLGIVNPTTLVGSEVKSILRERSFPFAKIVLLDSTGESAGALTDVGDEPAIVTAISATELEDLDVVFFCGSPAGNREWLENVKRYVAIDLSQPSSVEDGKLAIAGLNLDEISNEHVIVSPHPVTIPIAIILHQIEKATPIEFCTATVVQPASEYEQAGIEELAAQTIGVLNVQSVPQKIFDRQLAFNLYPAAGRNEDFVADQVRSILDSPATLALLITQGTVFHNHTFSLFIKTRETVDRQAIIETLTANPAIAFPEGDQVFGTIDAAGRDEILIAEVRADAGIEDGFWVWAVCDNLRRSSALNAVLIAEHVLFGAAPN